MISLYQMPKLNDYAYSMSPFCLKLELYLKHMNIAYENHFNLELNKSPTGKMPFIETQGKKFADSDLIISMLEKQSGVSIDDGLTVEQKAQSWAFIRMCEDSGYWASIYGRWLDGDNVSKWRKDLSNSIGMPSYMVTLLFPAMKRTVSKQIKGQGLSLLSKNEIYQKAEKDIMAFSNFIGDRKYFFNDKISMVDIVAFSFLVMIRDGSCGKRLQSIFHKSNLELFVSNMSDIFLV